MGLGGGAGQWEAAGVWGGASWTEKGGLLECEVWLLDLGSGCRAGIAGLSFGTLSMCVGI